MSLRRVSFTNAPPTRGAGLRFDPLFLGRVHLSGVRGDPAAASFWYRRARDLGATDAVVLLKALETE